MKILQCIPLFVCIFIIGYILTARVNTIHCMIETAECPDELIQQLNTIRNTSFFFTDHTKLLSEQQSQHPTYIFNTLKKKLPNTIILSFTQEEAEYILMLHDTTIFFGKSGRELPQQPEKTHLPTIHWLNEKHILSQSVLEPQYHTKFLHISQSLQKLNLDTYTLSWLSDTEITLDISGEPQFIFDSETIETQIKKVDTIIRARELDEIEKHSAQVDMRFDLPVLRTSQ